MACLPMPMPMGFTAIHRDTMTKIGSSPLILSDDPIITSSMALPGKVNRIVPCALVRDLGLEAGLIMGRVPGAVIPPYSLLIPSGMSGETGG